MKWQGKGVSEGLAMAQIHLFTPKLPEISRQPAADAEAEVAKLEATLAAAEEELRGLYETAKEKMGEQEAEIFDAHLTILGDEYSVREPIIQRIREQKQNAAAAITDQFDELAQMFRSLGDELMAERAADAEDLKQQLLRICLGCGRQDLSVLPGDVIVLAGKGHETYQEINGVFHHLDEREIVADWFAAQKTPPKAAAQARAGTALAWSGAEP